MLPTLSKIPASKYHADDIGQDRPALSSSIARILTQSTPFHAWLAHPKFGRVRKEPTPQMIRGSLIHALVFSQPLDDFRVIEADNYKTKAAQEQRDAATASGLIPVLSRELSEAKDVANDIHGAIQEAGFYLERDKAELCATWEEDTPHGPVLCRGLMDHVDLDRAVILDLKNVTTCEPSAFGRHVIDFGYDLQHAAYTSAIHKLNPNMAGREDFVWLCVEPLPEGAPQRVMLAVRRPDPVMIERGRVMWTYACKRWAECIAENRWPGYADAVVECPAWALK
jgi:hypothetical protein